MLILRSTDDRFRLQNPRIPLNLTVPKEPLLEKIEKPRREFVKRLVLGSAFAIPVLKSFAMDEVKAKSIYSAKVSF